MNKIEKLLRKISARDRVNLLRIIDRILSNDKNLKIIKIKNSDFLRVRQGKFRIIFHVDSGEIVIDSVKMRSENTYRNLNV